MKIFTLDLILPRKLQPKIVLAKIFYFDDNF